MNPASPERLRLDKWLWAARFYKTRSLAKRAIEGGKVRCDGQRCKVSREVSAGLHISLQQGDLTREIEVLALSDQRRGAPEAALLYRETEASLERAALHKARHSALRASGIVSPDRPSKKQRRQIHRFHEQMDREPTDREQDS
ncbi:MAG TPA: S4 domain-containing protein [Spongiibacteraceae bacterium]|nr:S4 domain-containing protein [Spongiibacteraceae bacterium]